VFFLFYPTDLSSEGASEIYLAELLDLYNDLMDIDPNQAKDSESLGEAQKNTNFFRDMLILMQETFHQVELIQQWGNFLFLPPPCCQYLDF
jgi:hypothetical protein